MAQNESDLQRAMREVREAHPELTTQGELTPEVLKWYKPKKDWSLNPGLLAADIGRILEAEKAEEKRENSEQRSSMGAFPEDSKFYYPRDSSR